MERLLKLRHQLEIPLKGIQLSCRTLIRRTEAIADADFLDDLDTIREETERSLALLRRTLSLSRLNADPIEIDGIQHALRNNLDAIIQSCDMASDNAAQFGAQREVMEILRTAHYFLHIMERDLRALRLPAKSGVSPVTESEPEQVETGSKLLLVDSDAELRERLSLALQEQGYTVEQTAASDQGLELLACDDFDLVILGLGIAGMDNFRMLREIRKRHDGNQLPIIIVVPQGGSEDILTAIRLGANDYVIKPVALSALLARLCSQLSIKRMTERIEITNMFIRSTLGGYLTDEVVDHLLDNPKGFGFQGEKRKVSVLFGDLRGFTSLSEHLEADTVVEVLNIFLGHMIDVVSEFDGLVDNFMGDGLMVLFGAPLTQEDDAERAVACAIAMQQAMTAVNARIRTNGIPPIAMGIGINTGEVVAGNIGSVARMKYSVIGRHVNIASRIESHTVGGQILISENTLAEAGAHLSTGGQAQIRVKSVETPITIYDVRGIAGQYNLFLPEQREQPVMLTGPSTSFGILEDKRVAETLYPGILTALLPSLKGGVIRAGICHRRCLI
ncbi:MAG: adenylate/guanylate cyclase domain-containing protein [Candidatus Competibacteraceae bacterium]